MIDMSLISGAIGALAPLPPTASRLAGVVADPKSAIDDVVEVLRFDQAITLDILRYANSAMSGSSRSITTLRDAVIRLGGARILEQIVGRHIKGAMNNALPGYGYDENDLWRHSVAAAVAAEVICAQSNKRGAGASFTAALLHDIGKLILGRLAPPDDMANVWKLLLTPELCQSCEQAERQVLGYSHAQIGAHVAELWQLPEPIVNAIRDHHGVFTHEDQITDTVKIANITARTIGQGIGNEGMQLAVDSLLAERNNISREMFEKICVESATRLGSVLKMFE